MITGDDWPYIFFLTELYQGRPTLLGSQTSNVVNIRQGPKCLAIRVWRGSIHHPMQIARVLLPKIPDEIIIHEPIVKKMK